MNKQKKRNWILSQIKDILGPDYIYRVKWALAHPKTVLSVLIGIFLIISYFYISQPKSLVINRYNEIEGFGNPMRSFLQGDRFLKDQLKKAEDLLRRSSNPYESIAEQMLNIDQALANPKSEIRNHALENITRDERYANQLRREADRIDKITTYRMIDNSLEERRLQVIKDCEAIIPAIESSFGRAGPTYTHWFLLFLLVIIVVFTIIQASPTGKKYRMNWQDASIIENGVQEHKSPKVDDSYYGLMFSQHQNCWGKINQEDYNGAIEESTLGIEKYPEFNGFYCCRGMAKFYAGDLSGSLQDYDQAIKTSVILDVDCYFFRGIVKYHLMDYCGAIIDLNNVISNVPNHGKAYFMRGKVKIAMNDNVGARKDLRIARNLDHPLADKLLAQLPD